MARERRSFMELYDTATKTVSGELAQRSFTATDEQIANYTEAVKQLQVGDPNKELDRSVRMLKELKAIFNKAEPSRHQHAPVELETIPFPDRFSDYLTYFRLVTLRAQSPATKEKVADNLNDGRYFDLRAYFDGMQLARNLMPYAKPVYEEAVNAIISTGLPQLTVKEIADAVPVTREEKHAAKERNHVKLLKEYDRLERLFTHQALTSTKPRTEKHHLNTITGNVTLDRLRNAAADLEDHADPKQLRPSANGSINFLAVNLVAVFYSYDRILRGEFLPEGTDAERAILGAQVLTAYAAIIGMLRDKD